MKQIEVNFSFEGTNTIIQCGNNDKLKDIYQNFKRKANAEGRQLFLMYSGNTIDNYELSFDEMTNFQDRERNKMNILVIEGEGPQEPQADRIIKSNNIICPECKEIIKFSIEDYKINLFDCKNKHDFDNMFLDEFESTQNINISKIICQNCGNYNKGATHNNIFYKCNTCKKDLCPICYSNHDKTHKLINYDDKDYICEEHNKSYNEYCEDCKKNICMYCVQAHSEHKTIAFGKLIPDTIKLNESLKELEEKKDKLDILIKEIFGKLNKVKENYDKYYNINKSLINNFNKDKLNYEMLHTINNITNNDIINDINSIINENSIQNQFNKLINIYDKINIINRISIIYNINKDDEEIKLFDEGFIKNNNNICKIIIDKKEYELLEKFNVKNYNGEKLLVKLSGINKITASSYMFYDCSKLSELPDISKWNTSNIENMRYMFHDCSSLLQLPDISKWNTINVKDMSYMFCKCSSLSSLPDISKWNTSNIENMKYMFSGCKSLTSLPDISKWDISKVKDIGYIFRDCSKLLSLPDISKWNTSNIENMRYVFYNCSSLSSLPDISKWNISNVNDMGYMFDKCSGLLELPDISKWNTSNVKNMKFMFGCCSKLSSFPDISKWNTINVSDMNSMFIDCSSLTSLPDISKWNTANLENNDDMFTGCSQLNTIPTIEPKK